MNESITGRFLVLRFARWLPTGLLIPVLVLFLLERGLGLTEIGLVFALQGLVVMALEVPTGGLADALGRRKLLLAAAVVDVGALLALLSARSVPAFGAAFALVGLYRALESGPLDAWYVDRMRGTGQARRVDRGLAAAGVASGIALAAGSLVSGLLVAWEPRSDLAALELPLFAAVALRTCEVVLVARLMTDEPRGPHDEDRPGWRERIDASVRSALVTMRASPALAFLLAVEVTWGFGMVSFETLFPPRLENLVDGSERAAAMLGPIGAGAWMASALGAAAIASVAGRLGRHRAAAAMRILQGGTVAAIGLVAGPAGAIAAYLACMTIHGAANPIHQSLLHDEADETNRATVLSLNSLAAQASGAAGGMVLGAAADGVGLLGAILLGAAVLAAGAPLYARAGRHRALMRPGVC